MNRRIFLRRLGAAALGASFAPHFLHALAAPRRKPNVIYILSDDQGTIDMNCYGAHDLHTPNMDKLAARGTRFTQFYAASCICSPSRAAFLTGKTPQAAGLPRNASSEKGRAGMPGSTVTLAEVMKAAGYKTAHLGKWHLGFTEDTMPNAQGFDYSFGHMGGCIDNYSHFFYWNGPNRHDLYENGREVFHDGQYFPDLITDRAIEYIEANKENPFFLYFAINLPHYPLQPSDKWRRFYQHLPHPRSLYAAFVSTVDERLGRIIDKVDQLDLARDTIFVFQSDHGHSTEIRTFGGGGSAGIYRGAKFSFFEGGIRIPAIIAWQNHLPENQVRDQMACEVDWLPTLAQLCGIDHAIPDLDGKSLVPLLTDPAAASPHDHYIWQLRPQWAVRQGDWKLLGNPQDPTQSAPLDKERDALFLANLRIDPTEGENLASRYPDKVRELTDLYRQWKYADESSIPQPPTPAS